MSVAGEPVALGSAALGLLAFRGPDAAGAALAVLAAELLGAGGADSSGAALDRGAEALGAAVGRVASALAVELAAAPDAPLPDQGMRIEATATPATSTPRPAATAIFLPTELRAASVGPS